MTTPAARPFLKDNRALAPASIGFRGHLCKREIYLLFPSLGHYASPSVLGSHEPHHDCGPSAGIGGKYETMTGACCIGASGRAITGGGTAVIPTMTGVGGPLWHPPMPGP